MILSFDIFDGAKESNQICGPVIQPVDHGPDRFDASFAPSPRVFGNFWAGANHFFFFDFSGLACKNIPTMPGYFFGIHSDLSDLKHFFFAQSHSDFSLICDKSCNWPNMYVSPCFLMGVTYQPSTSEPEISEPSRELRELNLSHNRLTTLPEKYEPGTEGVKLQLPVTELS